MRVVLCVFVCVCVQQPAGALPVSAHTRICKPSASMYTPVCERTPTSSFHLQLKVSVLTFRLTFLHWQYTHTHTNAASELPTAWNKTEIWPRLLSHGFELPLHLRLKHWWKRKTLQRPRWLFKADSGLPRQSSQRRNSKYQLEFLFLSLQGELSQNEKWIPFAFTFAVLMLLGSILFFINYRQLTFNNRAFWSYFAEMKQVFANPPSSPSDLSAYVKKNHTDPGFLFLSWWFYLFCAHTAMLWFLYLNVCRDSDVPEMRAGYLRRAVWWSVTLFFLLSSSIPHIAS